jgi:hypothetical protein
VSTPDATMLPPIRYPLPTLLVLVVVGLALWRGEAWTRAFRASIAARVAQVVEGPPLPNSDRPRVVAGPIVRRALLLHDDVAVSDGPGGRSTETIRRRQFVAIYDPWPLQGAPTHYRIGNRRPIGWVAAADLLPWDTRLVVSEDPARTIANAGLHPHGGTRTHPEVSEDPPRTTGAPALGRSSFPILASSPDAVQVAIWTADHPWSEVGAIVWTQKRVLTRESWGVWLTRDELLALLRRTIAPATAATDTPGSIRLRAILGRLLDDQPLTGADLQAACGALPEGVCEIHAASLDEARDRLARINERWSAEASWGGFSFQFLPLEALP